MVPSGGQLRELVIEHPEADRVRAALSAIGAKVTVVQSEQIGIKAVIQSKNGPVTLD